MLADSSLLRPTSQDKLVSGGPALLPAVRRGAQLPALAAAKGEGPSREAASVPAGLLDYAAFVLDQEAQYCQQ
jgi:hypothetical protein